MRLHCERCGSPFTALFPEGFNPSHEDLMCRRCVAVIHQEEKKKKYNPNETLEAEVREAAKRGLSYGQYKGGKR